MPPPQIPIIHTQKRTEMLATIVFKIEIHEVASYKYEIKIRNMVSNTNLLGN